jgi:hypothetical protein
MVGRQRPVGTRRIEIGLLVPFLELIIALEEDGVIYRNSFTYVLQVNKARMIT